MNVKKTLVAAMTVSLFAGAASLSHANEEKAEKPAKGEKAGCKGKGGCKGKKEHKEGDKAPAPEPTK